VAAPRAVVSPVASAAPTAFAVAGGAALALQSRLNGGLGERVGSPIVAALVSFGGGLAVLVLVVALREPLRRALRAAAAARQAWWRYIGGALGAALVAVAAAAVPVIGVATFTVGVVAGQVGGGLLVDRMGLGPGGRHALTLPRVAGAGVAVLAVVTVRLGIRVTPEVSAATTLALLLASAAAGLGVTVQQVLNGRLQAATGQPLLVTALNFLVGTSVLTLATAVAFAAGARAPGRWPAEPWLYVGGPIGIVVVLASVVTVARLGVLALGLALIAGQLAGGILLDLLQPARAGGVDAATLAGVLLTFVAVALASWPGRGPAAGPATGGVTLGR